MEAGKLRTLVQLQSATTAAADSWGAGATTWATYASVWAEVKPFKSEEKQSTPAGVETSTRYFVRIRYRADVDQTHRVVLPAGNVLAIAGIIDTDNRQEELRLDCVETPAA